MKFSHAIACSLFLSTTTYAQRPEGSTPCALKLRQEVNRDAFLRYLSESAVHAGNDFYNGVSNTFLRALARADTAERARELGRGFFVSVIKQIEVQKVTFSDAQTVNVFKRYADFVKLALDAQSDPSHTLLAFLETADVFLMRDAKLLIPPRKVTDVVKTDFGVPVTVEDVFKEFEPEIFNQLGPVLIQIRERIKHEKLAFTQGIAGSPKGQWAAMPEILDSLDKLQNQISARKLTSKWMLDSAIVNKVLDSQPTPATENAKIMDLKAFMDPHVSSEDKTKMILEAASAEEKSRIDARMNKIAQLMPNFPVDAAKELHAVRRELEELTLKIIIRSAAGLKEANARAARRIEATRRVQAMSEWYAFLETHVVPEIRTTLELLRE